MARRAKLSSLLPKPVKSLVCLKPQLPRATGPITRVRLFSLRDHGVEIQGDIFLKDGRLVCDPPDSILLRNELARPLRDDRGSEPIWIDPVTQPETFLETLAKAYGHGDYCWYEAVQE